MTKNEKAWKEIIILRKRNKLLFAALNLQIDNCEIDEDITNVQRYISLIIRLEFEFPSIELSDEEVILFIPLLEKYSERLAKDKRVWVNNKWHNWMLKTNDMQIKIHTIKNLIKELTEKHNYPAILKDNV